MYHSCSSLRLPPFVAPSNQYWVDQVPDVPFHRLSVLNSSSNESVAVEDRLFGSIVTCSTSLHKNRVTATRVKKQALPVRRAGRMSSMVVAKAEPDGPLADRLARP